MAVHHAEGKLVPLTQGPTALAPVGGAPLEGMEDLDSSDMILPRWSIIQPTSQKDGADQHPGQFVRNLDGEFRPYLEGVILQISKTRLLWSGDLNDKRPECFSRDGVHGSAYGLCAECRFNLDTSEELRAQREANPKAQLKTCGKGYTYVMVDDVETMTMALLGAMGTSVRPAKVLNTQFMQLRRPPFNAVVRFETEVQRNERGKYYVLKPRILRWLDNDQAAAMRELYLGLKGMTIKDIDEDEEGSPEEAGEANGAEPARESLF